MKRIIFILIAFILSNFIIPKSIAAPSPTGFGVHVGFFYSSLRPHGEWIELESGVQVWRPFHVAHQWRPYLRGRWIWTDEYGWYWMSNEPFGWITYHYGRWYYDDYYGWIWMPDDVWGPAWVEWRYDDDYVGWAPLPPYASFSIGFGIRFSNHWIAPAYYWNFVHYNRFGSEIRYRDIAPLEHTRRLIRTSRSDYRYDSDHDRIINRGVERSIIERRGNVRISSAEVRDVQGQTGERFTRAGGTRRSDQIQINRPTREELQRGSDRGEVRRGERALSLDMSKVNRSPNENTHGRVQQEQPRTNERRNDRTIQQPDRTQERQQQNKPRVQDQSSRQSRKEMRRELIQRYEQKQNISSPATRENRQQRVHQQREYSRRESSSIPSEKRSSHNEGKRRGR